MATAVAAALAAAMPRCFINFPAMATSQMHEILKMFLQV
jgi:hypothetical protein